ncbi:MAG TPA: hypothetical protein VK175_04865 [Leadbetterella sp.]|nr:hypothetical protein [Leadbetterella sp.]
MKLPNGQLKLIRPLHEGYLLRSGEMRVVPTENSKSKYIPAVPNGPFCSEMV